MTADPARKDVADLMRFGMAFETPGMFDAVEYYGRGPMENYADRSGAASWGVRPACRRPVPYEIRQPRRSRERAADCAGGG